jgi:predicted dienelactone hydrolase
MNLLATLLAVFVLAASSVTANQDWFDAKRNRTVPVRIMLPPTDSKAKTPYPVVIFSHGLGGSREASTFLGNAWTEAGYAVVYVQHPGSDTSVWQDKRAEGIGAIMQSMKAAANGEQLKARVEDIHYVLDELARRNQSDTMLKGKLDLSRIAMTGHSFGAGTTAAIAGQSYGRLGPIFQDKRIKCAIYFSPPVSAIASRDPAAAFSTITVPGFDMTGTEDVSPIGGTKAEWRRLLYDGVAAHDQYLVIFNGGDHMIFGGRKMRPGKDDFFQPRIAKLSTAFLDAYLRGDKEQLAWLKSQSGAWLGSAGTIEHK